MTTKECYDLMGADYEDVLGRLMSEKLVRKFLYKFADARDMGELQSSLKAQDYETAFRMAHNLRRVCQSGHQKAGSVQLRTVRGTAGRSVYRQSGAHDGGGTGGL